MELRDDTRPLSARSIVASTLLGVRPPRLPGRSLVASAALFGVAEGTVRTALSRMVAAGELVAEDGAYALAGPFLARRERQDASRSGSTRPWTGAWELAIVEADRRSAPDRSALRSAMRVRRLAELREGVWVRPDNLDPDRLPTALAVIEAPCLSMTGRPRASADALVELWDLDGWAAGARALEADLSRHHARLPERAELAPGFVLSAAVLRHLQADPLLPDELLPADWPGASLRSAYEAYDEAFKASWATHLRQRVEVAPAGS